MKVFSSIKQAEEYIVSKFGNELRFAIPLGLGKPNQLVNALYDRVKNQKNLKLTFFTALSLDIPQPKTELEARFTGPFFSKHFGDNYPRLHYVEDLQNNQVPENISLHEFYFQAGTTLGNLHAQSNYISLNYTHVAQSILEMNLDGVIQLIAKSPDGRYSLSCNPDLTLDVVELYRTHGKPFTVLGVVHPELPFLGGDAEVSPDFFEGIVESSEIQHKLFATPKNSIDEVEHMIGLHASRMIRDDGTLQIGIGSLSDALTASTVCRHQQNDTYKSLLAELDKKFVLPSSKDIHSEIFDKGLYGTSEMIMDGFMHLRQAGILKRSIRDHEENALRYLHGAFFLGSKSFYEWLRNLSEIDFAGLSMTRVSKVNDLYDAHELALRKQRKNARFFNTCMQMSLLGGAASETLGNGNVVSGVGGQYNFVAMSHELPDSYSVLMMKSTREKAGKRESNIAWNPSQLTISRHLRDVVITEYGIAFLKGQSDSECIKRLLMICDAEFQEELLEIARKNKKIDPHWQIPKIARSNTPAKIAEFARTAKAHGQFKVFPFGSDFSPVEERLQAALLNLKEKPRRQLIKTLVSGITGNALDYKEELERMKLFKPQSLKEILYQRVLLGSLKELALQNRLQ
ncbi:acetyl-CoA hydrolase [Bdellovibrio sp. SKB1291214]|uniref:acetyl-CoA hydrolase/transferase C-terminal domain-containing protein n=1 Tax=Bdellovibrio sp. SKB1291214 TaxID=1732569 RepID=UPI0020CBFCDA|nr:acetyl-CoA hydrolase/transferase C-terminal domain-containing protein [Bdellovibrio sp. SKB1291214]UYL07253.1 acetyl-CoA hydrolase [Bdellovibrio sp. SKB1291214]